MLSTLLFALSAAIDVVTVFQAGEEGYKCFRIPSLLRLPSGAIALFAEGRKTLGCLDHGWVDIVIKVSEDNGTTWGPLRKVYGESNETAHVTIGNPAPVVAGGRVVLLFCRDEGQGYVYCGELSYLGHDPDRIPIRFVWKLDDYDLIKGTDEFKSLVDNCHNLLQSPV